MFRNDIGSNFEAQTNAASRADAQYGVKDIGWQVLGPATACTILSTTVVAARWYTRYQLAQCVGLDDYVILLSVVLSCAMTSIIGVEVHHGIGVYDKHIPAATVAKLVVVNNVLWILIVNITKASILTQYLRIFNSQRIRTTCLILMFLLLPAACWGIFGGLFLCSPAAKLWNPKLTGHCMNASAYWYSVAGIDIVLDFLTLLLPLPTVTTLRLPHKQRLGLIMVFLLGFFVCVVSVVRLLTVLATSLAGELGASAVWSMVWSTVEANVGIVCASLLALKPLVSKLFPKITEENMLPRHSMQLPMIEAGVLADARTGSIPATPTTTTSKKSSNGLRASSRLSPSPRCWSPQSVPGWDDVNLSRPEESLSVFHMLRGEATAGVGRKDSSFL